MNHQLQSDPVMSGDDIMNVGDIFPVTTNTTSARRFLGEEAIQGTSEDDEDDLIAAQLSQSALRKTSKSDIRQTQKARALMQVKRLLNQPSPLPGPASDTSFLSGIQSPAKKRKLARPSHALTSSPTRGRNSPVPVNEIVAKGRPDPYASDPDDLHLPAIVYPPSSDAERLGPARRRPQKIKKTFKSKSSAARPPLRATPSGPTQLVDPSTIEDPFEMRSSPQPVGSLALSNPRQIAPEHTTHNTRSLRSGQTIVPLQNIESLLKRDRRKQDITSEAASSPQATSRITRRPGISPVIEDSQESVVSHNDRDVTNDTGAIIDTEPNNIEHIPLTQTPVPIALRKSVKSAQQSPNSPVGTATKEDDHRRKTSSGQKYRSFEAMSIDFINNKTNQVTSTAPTPKMQTASINQALDSHPHLPLPKSVALGPENLTMDSEVLEHADDAVADENQLGSVVSVPTNVVGGTAAASSNLPKSQSLPSDAPTAAGQQTVHAVQDSTTVNASSSQASNDERVETASGKAMETGRRGTSPIPDRVITSLYQARSSSAKPPLTKSVANKKAASKVSSKRHKKRSTTKHPDATARRLQAKSTEKSNLGRSGAPRQSQGAAAKKISPIRLSLTELSGSEENRSEVDEPQDVTDGEAEEETTDSDSDRDQNSDIGHIRNRSVRMINCMDRIGPDEKCEAIFDRYEQKPTTKLCGRLSEKLDTLFLIYCNTAMNRELPVPRRIRATYQRLIKDSPNTSTDSLNAWDELVDTCSRQYDELFRFLKTSSTPATTLKDVYLHITPRLVHLLDALSLHMKGALVYEAKQLKRIEKILEPIAELSRLANNTPDERQPKNSQYRLENPTRELKDNVHSLFTFVKRAYVKQHDIEHKADFQRYRAGVAASKEKKAIVEMRAKELEKQRVQGERARATKEHLARLKIVNTSQHANGIIPYVSSMPPTQHRALSAYTPVTARTSDYSIGNSSLGNTSTQHRSTSAQIPPLSQAPNHSRNLPRTSMTVPSKVQAQNTIDIVDSDSESNDPFAGDFYETMPKRQFRAPPVLSDMDAEADEDIDEENGLINDDQEDDVTDSDDNQHVLPDVVAAHTNAANQETWSTIELETLDDAMQEKDADIDEVIAHVAVLIGRSEADVTEKAIELGYVYED